METACRPSQLIILTFVVFLSATGMDVCSAGWVRFFAGRPSDAPSVPFGLLSTEDDGDQRLSATGWYRYIEGRDAVTLHGKKDSDGSFRPIVTYEVATEGKSKWKQIQAKIEQSGSETITVSSERTGVELSINMQPFRPAIGVYRYGRLVLENGDFVIFAIDDLLPSAREEDSGEGDFKIDAMQGDEEKKRQGFRDAWLAEPGDLVSVASVGGRVIGDFVFDNRSNKPVNLEGGRTPDGDFWPKVTLQAANSDQVWATIAKSQDTGRTETVRIDRGEAERIRVLLTDYKSLVGKYKYGKVVFSNGQAGIFYIDLLDPQNSLIVNPIRNK